MSKVSAIKGFLAGLITLASVIGCSSDPGLLNPDLLNPPQDINAFSDVSSAGVGKYPVFVTFNNAYKGLVEENEAIGRRDPNNADKHFTKLINSAKSTLDGAFYDIGDPDIVNAFIRAHKRGVKVRILTDTENLNDRETGALKKVIQDLKTAGIELKDDKRSALMHHKFLIVDNNIVWTGSLNLSTSSIYHHNNNSVMVTSPQIAANFNAEFKRIFEQGILGPNPHEIPHKEVVVGGASIRTYFSPKGGAIGAIAEELRKSKKSIKFMAFSMTDKNIRDIMTAKKTAGLKVEGIFDMCLSKNASIYWDLKKSNILSLRDGNQALMHHKTMIIDDETVVTGSFNFSNSAEQSNNENCLIIKSPTIAKLFNAEYSRLKYASYNNKNLPEYDHPACKSAPKPPVAPTPAQPTEPAEATE